jgi:hypothetical protein
VLAGVAAPVGRARVERVERVERVAAAAAVVAAVVVERGEAAVLQPRVHSSRRSWGSTASTGT